MMTIMMRTTTIMPTILIMMTSEKGFKISTHARKSKVGGILAAFVVIVHSNEHYAK